MDGSGSNDNLLAAHSVETRRLPSTAPVASAMKRTLSPELERTVLENMKRVRFSEDGGRPDTPMEVHHSKSPMLEQPLVTDHSAALFASNSAIHDQPQAVQLPTSATHLVEMHADSPLTVVPAPLPASLELLPSVEPRVKFENDEGYGQPAVLQPTSNGSYTATFFHHPFTQVQEDRSNGQTTLQQSIDSRYNIARNEANNSQFITYRNGLNDLLFTPSPEPQAAPVFPQPAPLTYTTSTMAPLQSHHNHGLHGAGREWHWVQDCACLSAASPCTNPSSVSVTPSHLSASEVGMSASIWPDPQAYGQRDHVRRPGAVQSNGSVSMLQPSSRSTMSAAASTPSHMNPARAAMIATAIEPPSPDRPHEGQGPRVSGINSLPLGRPARLDDGGNGAARPYLERSESIAGLPRSTSRQRRAEARSLNKANNARASGPPSHQNDSRPVHVLGGGALSLHDTNKSVQQSAKKPPRKQADAHDSWSQLCNHVRKAVDAVQDPDKVLNNGQDEREVSRRITSFLGLLRDCFIREERDQMKER